MSPRGKGLKEQAMDMLRRGASYKTICSTLGINYNTVRVWAFREGLTSRSRTGTPPGRENRGPEPGSRRSVPRYRTHLVIPDTQCKPGANLEYLLWIGRYIADRQPDVVVHLGDHWDMPSLSGYERAGSKWFEGKRVKEDIEAGNEGMRLLMAGMGNYRPERMVLLRGNHEDRIARACNNDPRLIGLLGEHHLLDRQLGWEVIPYLKPIEIDGVTYCHYFYNPNNGKPYSGNVETMLRNIGFSFTQGHQQGLRWGRRELPNGKVQLGLVAGSCYLHNEHYRGPQASAEWRGVIVKHEVHDGNYDPMFVSLDYLRRKYG